MKSIGPWIIILALALLSSTLAAPQASPDTVNPQDRDPPSAMFDCPDIDHHFSHQRSWIAGSSTSGCMTLEDDLDVIHALNQLASPRPPDYRRGSSLVCSLEQERCEWHYSPVEAVREQGSNGTTNGTTHY